MIHLKCTKVENNPELKEAVLWVKDNDDNIPNLMELSNGKRIDLIECWVFDTKSKLHIYQFDESNYIKSTEDIMDGNDHIRKVLISYRSMDIRR